MGMLIDGIWDGDVDFSMQNGTFRRETSQMPNSFDDDEVLAAFVGQPENFMLVASSSCPWSHATILARNLRNLQNSLALQLAGGPRIEGYALAKPYHLNFVHVHELYTSTIPDFTGRVTVPVLWDIANKRILSNNSTVILSVLNRTGEGPDLHPTETESERAELLETIFDGLSNAVYRAGLSQRQDEYDEAVDSVYSTMDMLEARLQGRQFLFGDAVTDVDLRLFSTLVRFDCVYATHFRCTRHRLTEFENLWRYARQFYHLSGVAETIDFDEIRRGYYLNDGDHNPHNIVAEQPIIDWTL